MKKAFNPLGIAAAAVVAMGLSMGTVALAENNTNQTTGERQVNHNQNPNQNPNTNTNQNSNMNTTNTNDARNTGDENSYGTDAWITTKVKSSLLADSETSGMDVKVETNDGVVTLTGEVENEAKRNRAIEVAKSIEGVKSVASEGLRMETHQ